MAVITEEGLRGEWFYLEEGQLLDSTVINFYVLCDGAMRTGDGAEVIGTYFIEGNRAVITINQTEPMTTEIALYSTEPTFDNTTGLMQTSAIYALPDGRDPLYIYGSFVRRIADFTTTGDIRGSMS